MRAWHTKHNQIKGWRKPVAVEANRMNAKQLIQKVLGVSLLVAVLASSGVGPVAAAPASVAPLAVTSTLSAQEAIQMNAGKKIRNLIVSLSVLSALLLSALVVSPAAAATSPLSADEIAGLQFMREEEKLAHDVYVTFYQQYGLAIFNNIANGEATHMASVKTLLDRYGLADPAAGNGVGVFENADLQALYNQLIAQGRQSLSAALKVGGAIEEIDILDLKERSPTTHVTSNRCTQFANGSYNHLRAFVNTLQAQTGEVYQPQYLDAATYQTIIASTNGRRGGLDSNGGRRW
jgi:hypothetical protein